MTFRRAPLSRNRARGQALAEFVIAATLVLVPVFLIIPMLGKYIDIKSSTVQAARYAAWERTVWYGKSASSDDWDANEKDDTSIGHEIAQRIYANATTTKFQDSDKGAGAFGGGSAKSLWKDRAGNSLVDYNNVSDSQSNDSSPGTLNEIMKPLTDAIDTVSSLLGADFKVETDGLYTATVTVNVTNGQAIGQVIAPGALNSTENFSGLNLTFTAKNVVLGNGWSANGSDMVKSQVEGLVPLSVLARDPIKTVLNIFQYATAIIAPELMPNNLKIGGEIQPDIVPGDRIYTKP
ncbi:MAG TPA: TadE family protein [Burkholderiales bacterium]|nr:TadE family protein [Burkholderiales bacterium]